MGVAGFDEDLKFVGVGAIRSVQLRLNGTSA